MGRHRARHNARRASDFYTDIPKRTECERKILSLSDIIITLSARLRGHTRGARDVSIPGYV